MENVTISLPYTTEDGRELPVEIKIPKDKLIIKEGKVVGGDEDYLRQAAEMTAKSKYPDEFKEPIAPPAKPPLAPGLAKKETKFPGPIEWGTRNITDPVIESLTRGALSVTPFAQSQGFAGRAADALEGAGTAATLAFAPEIGSALGTKTGLKTIGKSLVGAGIGGAAGRTGAGVMGAGPEGQRLAGDVGGVVGGGAGAISPKIASGLAGAVKGAMRSAVTTKTGNIGVPASFASGAYLASKGHPAIGALTAIAPVVGGAYEGMMEGAAGKPWINPTVTNFLRDKPQEPPALLNAGTPPRPSQTAPQIPPQQMGPGAGPLAQNPPQTGWRTVPPQPPPRPPIIPRAIESGPQQPTIAQGQQPPMLGRGPIITPPPTTQPIGPDRQLQAPEFFRGSGSISPVSPTPPPNVKSKTNVNIPEPEVPKTSVPKSEAKVRAPEPIAPAKKPEPYKSPAKQEDANRYSKEFTDEGILEWMNKRYSVSGKELQEKFGFTEAEAKRRIMAMHSKGLVKRAEQAGHWSVEGKLSAKEVLGKANEKQQETKKVEDAKSAPKGNDANGGKTEKVESPQNAKTVLNTTPNNPKVNTLLAKADPSWEPGKQITHQHLGKVADDLGVNFTQLGNALHEAGYDVQPSKFHPWGLTRKTKKGLNTLIDTFGPKAADKLRQVFSEE